MIVDQCFRVVLILALLLQPVGTTGWYGVFAFHSVANAAETNDTEESASGDTEEDSAADEEEEVDEADDTEEVTEALPEDDAAREESVGSEAETVADTLISENALEEVTTSPEADTEAIPEALPEESSDTEDTSLDMSEEDGNETEEVAGEVVEEVAPSESPEAITTDSSTEPEEALVEDNEEKSEAQVWERDGDVYTTVDAVEVGQTYVFPEDDTVKLLFTKLPAEAGTVSMRAVKLSLEEQAALGAITRTAYEVTSSMENGSFEYELTLPLPDERESVRVKYVEADEALNTAQYVDSDALDMEGEAVTVTLDHFTIFITTYGDPLFSVEKSTYARGETLYGKATNLNDVKYYRMALDPPTGDRIYLNTCFNPASGVTTYTDSYVFPVEAVLGAWAAEIKEYTTSNCTGAHVDAIDSFTLVAEVTEDEGDNGNFEVTLCHATPPDTGANGYQQLVVDDDSIFVTGHASEHAADIIPPFESGELSFPGQNWDALGQAIWANACGAVGKLQAMKLVDDQSDLTQWSFQLNENTPVAASPAGLVDFGYVPIGEYTLRELGTVSYALVNVAGEGCAWDSQSGLVEATVVAGETTTCTFSNAVDKASLTLIKEVEGDDPQDFTFLVGGVSTEPVVLDDDGNNDNEHPNFVSFTGLWPGTYSLTEEVVEGWLLEEVSCVSSMTETALDVATASLIELELTPGESVTCTFTNKKVVSDGGDDPYCGDGILNQESEQCDGEAGLEEGYFCTFHCRAVPVYDGGDSCQEGTEPVKVASYFISGTEDPDGRAPTTVSLEGGKDYLLEATGDYSYGGVVLNNSLNRADAAYSSDDAFAGPNLLNDLFGIAPGAYYRGVHTLISDLGTGTLGVVDWGAYRSDHTYPLAMSPAADADVQFVISDWYDEWYSGDWLSEPNKNQQGFRDNADGLTLNVYECQEPATGSITVVKEAEPNDVQDFGFVLNPGFQEFVLDDDEDSLLSDSQSFIDLPAGEYTITEGLVPGWELESVSCVSDQRSLLPSVEPTRTLDLQSGEHITCVFTNVAKNGSIIIKKDATPNHPQDFGYAMNGNGFLEFVLDDDDDPLLSNTATFTSLLPGTYSVTEGLVPGWELSTISCVSNTRELADSTEPIRTIELGVGETVTCTFFNTQTSNQSVCGNGVIDVEGEQCDGSAGVTPGENFCTFSCTLVPIYDGGGTCSEGKQAVEVGSYFVPATFIDGNVPAPTTINLTGGKEYVIEALGTFGYGGIPVNNAEHRADAAYATDTNFVGPNLDTLFGSPATALYRGIHNLISDFGTGTFGVVNWGSYNLAHVYTQSLTPAADTNVQYAISDWYDGWYSGDELSDFNTNQFGFRDNEGGLTLKVYECQGGEEEIPRLVLRKFNDSVSDEVPGNEVVYTLEVTALGGPVDDVTVTDLPPEGFAYVPGSGEGAPFIHAYASPGIWDLGDMSEGETKTLTYKTTISGSQDAGLYKDLAFAKGVSGASTLFANSPSTPFVGTDVNVVLPTDTPTVELDKDTEEEKERKTKTKTQYVLGAATSLPLTGTPWQWMLGALALLVVGATLRYVGRKKMGKGTVLGLLVLGLSLGGSLTASAANLSVEIETPETLVASPDFKIGFVTLDTLNRPLTVDCFTTLSAVPFASYVLDATFGGNAGNCQVNASALPSDGNYEFFVRARATGEGDETVESNHVTVTLASTFPGTPTNYDRNNPGCDHVITFTTADDGGKTVKVELYRSNDNPFVANSSTKVTEVAIGSNTNGSFTVPAPGCDDDTLYALRAVDTYGRGSGFVGDTEVKTDTVTVTTTRTRTVVLPGSATGAIPVTPSGTQTPEPAVQGAETTNTETGSGEATETGSSDESVLGVMTMEKLGTWFDEHPWLTGLLAILATLIGYIGYTRFLNRRDDADPLS